MPNRDAIDLTNRDPDNMNNHVQVEFIDVIGEPEGAYSPDCIYTCTYKCFRGAKNCCYFTLAAICGVPLSCCWGITFALISFCNIWTLTPCFRAYSIFAKCCINFIQLYYDCYFGTLCAACGNVCSRIKVQIVKD